MAAKIIIYAGLVVVLSLSYFGWKLTARGAYESAEYTVLVSDGPFETREYPDLILATTAMQFESQGEDGSFMRLFRYIRGANDRQKKISMTVPVFMKAESRDKDGQMGFLIPAEVSQQYTPEPSSENVEIRRRAGGVFAVIRFAGRMNGNSVSQAEYKLRDWINEKGLLADGEAEFAGYDPPWTPGPLRRNEILIRLK
jgi:hypothetical protein